MLTSMAWDPLSNEPLLFQSWSKTSKDCTKIKTFPFKNMLLSLHAIIILIHFPQWFSLTGLWKLHLKAAGRLSLRSDELYLTEICLTKTRHWNHILMFQHYVISFLCVFWCPLLVQAGQITRCRYQEKLLFQVESHPVTSHTFLVRNTATNVRQHL